MSENMAKKRPTLTDPKTWTRRAKNAAVAWLIANRESIELGHCVGSHRLSEAFAEAGYPRFQETRQRLEDERMREAAQRRLAETARSQLSEGGLLTASPEEYARAYDANRHHYALLLGASAARDEN